MTDINIIMAELAEPVAAVLHSDKTQSHKLDALYTIFFDKIPHSAEEQKRLETLLGSSKSHAAVKQEPVASVIMWMFSLEDVPDEEVEKYCKLGELLSLAAGDRNAWVVFKRLFVQFLVEHGRIDEAVPEINKLSDLLPDDREIQDMAKKTKKRPSVQKKRTVSGANTTSAMSEKSRMKTGCDNEFYSLIEQLKTKDLNQLLTNAANWANRWVEEDHEYYGLLLKWYRSWYRVGLFGQDQGFINYFGGMYQYLKQHLDDLVWLYEGLADYRSKLTLKIILQHWMTFHPNLCIVGREVQFPHYFDLDIIKCNENEVFVDCGCFDGDTVKDFVKSYGGKYKSIYSYELTPATYEIAKKNLTDIPRLYLRNAGVSDKNGQFPFLSALEGNSQGGNRLNANGNAIAKTVRIDDDIQENVTFIKMDIEGAECEALRGAEQQIRRNKPKLAISLYHKLSDLLEIPRLVKSYVPEYKLYLRHNFDNHRANNDFPFPSEYVLLAVV